MMSEEKLYGDAQWVHKFIEHINPRLIKAWEENLSKSMYCKVHTSIDRWNSEEHDTFDTVILKAQVCWSS